MDIYLHQSGERTGPFTLEKVQSLLDAGEISVTDAAWFEGCGDWVTAQDIPGVLLPGGDHFVVAETVPPFDAYQGNEPYVFVSYSHKDSAHVYGEIMSFHEDGCNVWYDEGIEASNEWPEEIARAVVECSVFLVFVTANSTASVNCRNEINLALNENKPFIAIHLEETELPLGLRLRMGDLQAILRYKLSLDRYQKKALDALHQLLGNVPAKKTSTVDTSAQPETFVKAESVTPARAIPPALSPGSVAQSKPRNKGLAVAVITGVIVTCVVGGYLGGKMAMQSSEGSNQAQDFSGFEALAQGLHSKGYSGVGGDGNIEPIDGQIYIRTKSAETRKQPEITIKMYDEAAIEKIRREADSALERGLAEVHAESTWDDFRKKVLVDAVGRVTASEDATSDADGEFTLPPSSNRFMLAATVEYHPAVGAGFQWLEFFQRDNIGRSGLFLSDKNLLGKTKDSLTLPSEAKSRFDAKVREAASTKPPQ